MQMSAFKRGLLFQNGVLLPDYDNYDFMLMSLDTAKEDFVSCDSYVRFEVSPRDCRNMEDLMDVDSWVYTVHQDILPDWYDSEKDEQRARDSVKQWARKHILVDSKIPLIFEGTYYMINSDVEAVRGEAKIHLYGSSSVKSLLDNAIVENMYDRSAVVCAYGNSTINNMFDKSSVTYLYNSSNVGCMFDKSSVTHLYNSSKVDCMFDQSYVRWMHDTSSVCHLMDYGRINCMEDNSVVCSMHDSSRIDSMENNSFVRKEGGSVEEMSNFSIVQKFGLRNKIIVCSEDAVSEFNLTKKSRCFSNE